MCNFVPGECLGLVKGEIDSIRELLAEWQLPGLVGVTPLLPENFEYGPLASEFRSHVLLHVTGIPQGLEVLAVSKLSAALGKQIGDHSAVVELNQYLAFGAQPALRRSDEELSARARQTAQSLRDAIQANRGPQHGPPYSHIQRPVALLDSGIAFSRLPQRRSYTARDYAGARSYFGRPLEVDHDALGHGTRVCRILDESLPDDVPLVSGRIAGSNEFGITVLRVATAFAHLVALDDPAVVNISLAPRDDEVICPHCRRAVPVDAFHSLILAYVFRLAAGRTLAVMAAGNRGQIGNARHAMAGTPNLALVEAMASTGKLAPYSNRVDAGFAAVARHFGGDADLTGGGGPVFEGVPGTYGTSFAAPFVAAAAYAYSSQYGTASAFELYPPSAPDFGTYCGQTLRVAIAFQPSNIAVGQVTPA